MTMNDTNQTYYKVREAAYLLGVSPLTVYRWLRDGTLRGVRIGPKLLRIPRSEIERMAQGLPKQQPEPA